MRPGVRLARAAYSIYAADTHLQPPAHALEEVGLINEVFNDRRSDGQEECIHRHLRRAAGLRSELQLVYVLWSVKFCGRAYCIFFPLAGNRGYRGLQRLFNALMSDLIQQITFVLESSRL